MTKRGTCVVRKGSLTYETPDAKLYLQRDGTWGPYKTAWRFRSQDKAEAEAYRITGNYNWGLFR